MRSLVLSCAPKTNLWLASAVRIHLLRASRSEAVASHQALLRRASPLEAPPRIAEALTGSVPPVESFPCTHAGPRSMPPLDSFSRSAEALVSAAPLEGLSRSACQGARLAQRPSGRLRDGRGRVLSGPRSGPAPAPAAGLRLGRSQPRKGGQPVTHRPNTFEEHREPP